MIQQFLLVILLSSFGTVFDFSKPMKDLDSKINEKSSPPALSSIQIDWKKLFDQFYPNIHGRIIFRQGPAWGTFCCRDCAGRKPSCCSLIPYNNMKMRQPWNIVKKLIDIFDIFYQDWLGTENKHLTVVIDFSALPLHLVDPGVWCRVGTGGCGP